MIDINKRYLRKSQVFLLICTFIISINTFINAKYIMQNQFCIANLNIDRTKPCVELVSISNTNFEYEKYANNTHTITINVKLIEKNIKNVYFDEEHVKAKVEDTYVSSEKTTLTKIENVEDGQIYQIKLNNINGNGNLKIEILEGTIVDESELTNDLKEIDTKIIIDNIAPESIFSENKISDGRVNGRIDFNEKVRYIDGWDISENKLKIEKEFTNNISYELPIVDYAGNKSIVDVDITKATYINIIYASHNSEVGWTFGYGNYDIAGKKAVEMNPIFKTEALAFNISGNIDSDFIQAKSYVYTHWGEGSIGKCMASGLLYNYGYNPNDGTYKSMKSNDLVTIEGKKYFQFGGSGINLNFNTDINGNNPIPSYIGETYKYGICGIQLKLKDYSQFSVIYQIFVDKVGWIESCFDGEECMYDKVSPMSAFRIALVPKSEKQYVLDTWNKDIGTFNMK